MPKKCYNEKHEEIPDQTPLEWPIDAQGPGETLAQKIRRIVDDEYFQKENSSLETFKEFNDLDIEDDDGDMIESSHQNNYNMVQMANEEFEKREYEKNAGSEDPPGPQPPEPASEPEKTEQ